MDSASDMNTSVQSTDSSALSKLRARRADAGRLLRKIVATDTAQDDAIFRQSRELLDFVFAKANQNEDSGRHDIVQLHERKADRGSTTTATFLTRYRAMRAASILCPQDALERALRDGDYGLNFHDDPSTTLSLCAFGSFVAKEIEAMGLPLPHSSLFQLSTMHFPSYARALWRHHRADPKRLSHNRGRLCLLLMEMTIREPESHDSSFVAAIFGEVRSHVLPRSALECCEEYASYRSNRSVQNTESCGIGHSRGSEKAEDTGDGDGNDDGIVALKETMEWLTDRFCAEGMALRTKTDSASQGTRAATTEMMNRLVRLAVAVEERLHVGSQELTLSSAVNKLRRLGQDLEIPLAAESWNGNGDGPTAVEESTVCQMASDHTGRTVSSILARLE